MTDRRLKLLCTISLLSIFCCASWYTLIGFPIPRPIPIFVLLGFSLSLLSGAVFFAESRVDYTLIAAIGMLNGFFLRASAFLTVVSSGLDHGRWLSRTSSVINTGSVAGSDMYAASPVYIIEMAISNQILGGPVYSVRFVTLLIGSLFPLILFLVAYTGSYDIRVSVFALLLTVPFVLYIRTATLMEAESMALPWFALAVFLFIRSLRVDDKRYYTLLTVIVGTAVMLHFFYSVVILLLLLSVYIIHIFSWYAGANQLPGNINAIGAAIAVGLVITPVWMLWSTYSHTAAVTLLSAFSIPAYDSVAQIFIPSTGASAQGTGTSAGGDSGSHIVTLAKFFPLVAVFGAGGLGGIYAIIAERRRYYSLILFALVIGGSTFAVVTVQLDYNLGFRMYYFAGIFAIIFTSILFAHMINIQFASVRRCIFVSVIIFILLTAIGGPLSPLGNNIDPKFGGSSWTVTKTDIAERNAMDSWTRGETQIPHRLEQVHNSFSPYFKSGAVYLAKNCGSDSKVGTTGGLVLCGVKTG
ncbi:hypothetical protein [Haloarcula sp. Atlit-7R]|uniref:hypothetical protein n=1 Tax=Haloarcula sp. Atlit-7R TaxID=2282125 RepID=UPI000EF14156|nr:hypothetical protein [Haloarcula sp. Atlit-7R]RLM95885.1 hypothetical protein D3D01_10960 [Haloarcula sp. Atlit-7R]